MTTFEARPIGQVESPLKERKDAPRQPDEGAPAATLVIDPEYVEALDGIRPGDKVIVITWLDQTDRSVLRVTPRRDPRRGEMGVFATRSPDRPNPIGLHEVEVTSVDGTRVGVRALEAIDGTPILDLKPVLNADVSKR